MKRFLALVRRLAEQVEATPLTLAASAGTLAGVVALRHLLEIATGRYPIYTPVQFFVHYPLAYIAPFLALSLLLAFFAGERPERTARLMLLAWLLTLLPPLWDIAWGAGGIPVGGAQVTGTTGPAGAQIGYLVAESGPQPTFLELLRRFFDPTVSLPGTTQGIRVETAIACLLGALYVLVKGRGLVRALLCAAAVLPAALAFFTLPVRFQQTVGAALGAPSMAELYGRAGRIASVAPPEIADLVIVSYLVPLSLLLAVVAFRETRRAPGALATIDGIAPAACALIGAVVARPLATGAQGAGAPAETIATFAVALACWFGAAAAGCAAERGLAVCWGLAAGALALGAALGAAPFALIAALIGLRLLDTLPPVRLGRLPVLGEAAGAACAVAAGLAGASIFFGVEAIVRFPPSLGFTLAAGGALLRVSGRSGEGGVRTLRAVAVFLACLAPPLLIGETPALLPAMLFGAAAGLVVWAGEARAIGRVAPLTAGLAFALSGCLAGATPSASGRLQIESLRAPEWHLRRGEEARRRGQNDLAEAAWREALRRDPDCAAAVSQLGALLLEKGQRDEAIALLERAAELEGRSPRALGNLSAALLADGQVARALESAEQALLASPEDCTALFNRAAALERRAGGVTDALAGWRRYLEVCGSVPSEASSAATAAAHAAALEHLTRDSDSPGRPR